MNRRKRSVLVALGLLGAAYAFSLVHVFRGGRPAPAGGKPPGVIRFVHWQLESGMREAFDQMARRYMALHPDVRVEQFAVPIVPISEIVYGAV